MIAAVIIGAAILLVAQLRKGGGIMPTSANSAVEFILPYIKEKEGFRPTPYPDNSQYSTGYGSKYIEGQTPNPITPAQAEALLINLLNTRYQPGVVADLAAKGIAWNSLAVHQQGAILSFAYNLGPNICASATWPQKYKAGDIEAAKASWLAHNKERRTPGGPLTVNQVLAQRRIEEWNIFTKGRP